MIRPILLAATLVACSAATPVIARPFDPLSFFTGASRGVGRLKIILQPAVPIRVESIGRPDGKGGIILDQIIREGSKPPRQRRWTLRQTSPTTMSGTITDTPGLVEGRMVDNRLLLNYAMKNGMQAEQVLALQADGSLLNRMTVRRLGLTVARLEETITRVDSSPLAARGPPAIPR